MIEAVEVSGDTRPDDTVGSSAEATEKTHLPSISSKHNDVSSSNEVGIGQTGQEFVVDFEGETDVSSPQNWSRGRKWLLIVLVSLLDFAV